VIPIAQNGAKIGLSGEIPKVTIYNGNGLLVCPTISVAHVLMPLDNSGLQNDPKSLVTVVTQVRKNNNTQCTEDETIPVT